MNVKEKKRRTKKNKREFAFDSISTSNIYMFSFGVRFMPMPDAPCSTGWTAKRVTCICVFNRKRKRQYCSQCNSQSPLNRHKTKVYYLYSAVNGRSRKREPFHHPHNIFIVVTSLTFCKFPHLFFCPGTHTHTLGAWWHYLEQTRYGIVCAFIIIAFIRASRLNPGENRTNSDFSAEGRMFDKI